jgi:hypothetical protein
MSRLEVKGQYVSNCYADFIYRAGVGLAATNPSNSLDSTGCETQCRLRLYNLGDLVEHRLVDRLDS